MARATAHLLPPPPPPIIETQEITTINPETGESTITLQQLPPIYPPAPEPEFDVVEEAAKMPLEVAVACSLLTIVPERVKGLAEGMLLIGGGAHVEGLADGLRWR